MFNGAEFNRNVSQHTLEELEPYFEQYVAWSMDGKQILAHAQTREDLAREIERLGLKDYVGGFIWNPEIGCLGSYGFEDASFDYSSAE
jgi:hypothetical protein